MPELPEVETLRRGLERTIVGRSITGVVVANPKVLKGQAKSIFEERVVGRRIAAVDRRGKYLLIPLVGSPVVAPHTQKVPGADPEGNSDGTPTDSDSPITLCVHLKMRGQIRLQSASDTADPPGPGRTYHCISLLLDNGAAVRYDDMWTWGEVRALTAAELAGVNGLAAMGPEPLDESWDAEALGKALAGRRTAIKPTLLEQKVVAGVGNIYADESLFRSGIHPQRPACSLTEAEISRLADAIKTILTEAVNRGGTTSDEFVDLGGAAGRYRPQVYDRGGQPCPVCQTPLTRIRLGGRGTVFCANCQPSYPPVRPMASPDDAQPLPSGSPI